MIALEIDTDYFIEEQNLKMVKSKYLNLYKKRNVVDLVLIMSSN